MKTAKITILWIIICSFMSSAARLAVASSVPHLGAPVNLKHREPTDPAEIETFLDQLFNQQMEEYHFAGIAAVVVKDGQTLFQKGYGYSDLENQIPVNPAETLFRIGSITKLFTWTAIHQLSEQGKLDLDADINTYLDFQIPDAYPEPITLRHLMSHTGGFEAREFELGVRNPGEIKPLGQYLAAHIPARVYPAGQVSVYSNYGTDLAGYIIERVAGMPYEDYIEANILKPLGMMRTTPRQPLPSWLAAEVSNGYIYVQNAYQQQDFQIGSTPSCGAISSTAEDMAQFMLAHLQGGSLCPGGVNGNSSCVSILQPDTEQLMQSSLWGPDPRVPGYAHGFMEWNFNGQRILYHAGDTRVFQSMLMLLPEQNLGFFYAYNTMNPAINPWDVTLIAFMQHYYPVDLAAFQPALGFHARAETYTGSYFLARSSYTTIEKVNNLRITNWIELTASEDGALLIGLPISPQKIRLEEVEPMLFREASTGIQLAFQMEDTGRVVYLYDAHQPSTPWVKMVWHQNPMLHYGLVIVCSVIFLSALLAGLFSAFARIFKRGDRAAQPASARFARRIALVVAILDLSALVAFLVVFLGINGFGAMIAYGEMSTINVILTVWLAAAVLTLGVVALTIIAWKQGFWGRMARIHYSLVTLAALAFVWFLNYWNLLGFRY